MEAMWLMLQRDEPDDFVVATGETHSVREFVEKSFARIGRELEWRGEGVDEIGVEKGTGITRIKVNPRFFRPAEVVGLQFMIFHSHVSKILSYREITDSFLELGRICCSETRARPEWSSDGRLKFHSMTWSMKWSILTLL